MPGPRPQCLALIGALWLGLANAARAEEPPVAAIPTADRALHPFPPAGTATGQPSSRGGAASGSWLGPIGMALALAGVGVTVWAVVAKRAKGDGVAAAPPRRLRVVGRTALTPRHAIHLVRAGNRVLMIGTGPQGAPTLLGELDEPPATEAAS